MPNLPPDYNRGYGFGDYQTSNPSDPLPGDQVDAELDKISDSINGMQLAWAPILDEDGDIQAIANRGVKVPSGDPAAAVGVELPAVDARKGKYLYFDDTTGYVTVNSPEEAAQGDPGPPGPEGPVGQIGPAGFGFALAEFTLMTAIPAPLDGMIVHITDPLKGGLFRFTVADTEPADGGIRFAAQDGSTGRWVRQYVSEVNPEWFGMIPGASNTGDAAANTAALMNAVNTGLPVRIPAKNYFLLEATLSVSAKVRAGGSTLNPIAGHTSATITANAYLDWRGGYWDCSLNDQACGFDLNAGGVVEIDEAANFDSALGASGSHSFVRTASENCRVKVHAVNFANTGNSNGSCPRVVSHNAGSDYCRSHVTGENLVCGVVWAGGILEPSLHMDCREMSDNGLYNLGGIRGSVEFHRVVNGEEPLVEATGQDTTVHKAEYINCALPIGLQSQSGTLTFQNLYWFNRRGACPAVIRTRSTNVQSDHVVINNLHIDMDHGSNIFNFGTGGVRSLSINGRMKTSFGRGYLGAGHVWALGNVYDEGETIKKGGLYYTCFTPHTSSATDEPGVGVNWALYWIRKSLSLLDWSAGERFSFCNTELIVEDLTGELSIGAGNFFAWDVPTVTKPSFLVDFLMRAEGDHGIRIANAMQDNIVVQFGQGENTSGHYFREITANGPNKLVMLGGIPTTGKWKQGDMVVDISPTNGNPAIYHCTVGGDFAGTPPVFLSAGTLS